MKKGWKILLCSMLAIVLILGSIFVLAADENPQLAKGEILDGDYITGGSTVTNDGNILGDFIAGAQDLINTGTVEGDLIAGAYSASINGSVQGSVRIGANDIDLSAVVGRNAMIAANSVILGDNSVINRNGYIFGTTIIANGQVKGDLNLAGQFITLGGTYEGDVKIANGGERVSFEILPGTVIKGVLTYEGVNKYELPKSVQVGEYKFIMNQPETYEAAKSIFTVGTVIKTILTMLLYYLFALLLYKLFPKFFSSSEQLTRIKPLSAAGIGVATIGCLVAGAIFLLILLFLVIAMFNLSVLWYAGLLFVFVAAMTLLLADIPVAVWIGNRVSNRRMGVPGSLAIGLAIITIVKIFLAYLKTISVVSGFAGIILFITNLVIYLIGTGVVVKTVFAIGKAANRQAEAECFEDFGSPNYDGFDDNAHNDNGL